MVHLQPADPQRARLPIIDCRPTLDLTQLTRGQMRAAAAGLQCRPVGAPLQVYVDQHPASVDISIPNLLADAAVDMALHVTFVGEVDLAHAWAVWVRDLVARRLVAR